jgi:hypothetical protein
MIQPALGRRSANDEGSARRASVHVPSASETAAVIESSRNPSATLASAR